MQGDHMKCASAMDYNKGVKRNWRRRIWNLHKANTADQSRALCLYLAGPKDYDRPIAIDKGFDTRNIIAIERQRSTYEELMQRGVDVIHGDVLSVIGSWPNHVSVQVAHLDLMGCIARSLIDLIHVLFVHPAFATASICVNIQRGREREMFPIIQTMSMGMDDEVRGHRGVLLICAAVIGILSTVAKHDEVLHHAVRTIGTAAIINGWRQSNDAVIGSYVSHRNVMDWVAWKNCGVAGLPRFEPMSDRMSKTIAAKLAWRTRRRMECNRIT